MAQTFISTFAGVGGFDLGFERAGLKCIGQVEIDKKCITVLENHWPSVPRHDDIRTAKEWADEQGLVGKTDIVCGGFPCQDVSVAGKREGLAGERTRLFWDALAFATHVQARWLVLENVPGLLTSNQGRDFGTILLALAEAGYMHVEWRVLDSQFFGVAQRRRRVFIVAGAAGTSGRPLLIESEGGSGNSPKGGKTGEEVAGTLGGGASLGGWACDTDRMTFVPYVKKRRAQSEDDYETWENEETSPTLNAFDNATEVRATVVATRNALSFYSTDGMGDTALETSPTLKLGSDTSVSPPAVALENPTEARRLTPLECERLQGFPDGWTSGLADTQRYRQMGNAVTVPVAQWIAEKIIAANE